MRMANCQLPIVNCQLPARGDRHRGFTLVELLVAIALILVLVGILILFVPSALDSDKAARGGTMVQQALQIARTRAIRDRAPRGIRLVPDAAGLVREIRYVEQPDDFTASPDPASPGPLLTPNVNNLARVALLGVDLTNQSGPLHPVIPDPSRWSVLPGDYLEVFNSGQARRINSLFYNPKKGNPGHNPALAEDTSFLDLMNPLPVPVQGSTRSYRIMRAPRPTGEDALQLPNDVAIDLSTNVTFGNAFVGGDIMFAPGGQVILPRMASDFIALWVRDVSRGSDPFDGEPSIIGVYVRSGAVAAQDPDRNNPNNDPYAFLRDGRSSGK